MRRFFRLPLGAGFPADRRNSNGVEWHPFRYRFGPSHAPVDPRSLRLSSDAPVARQHPLRRFPRFQQPAELLANVVTDGVVVSACSFRQQRHSSSVTRYDDSATMYRVRSRSSNADDARGSTRTEQSGGSSVEQPDVTVTGGTTRGVRRSRHYSVWSQNATIIAGLVRAHLAMSR